MIGKDISLDTKQWVYNTSIKTFLKDNGYNDFNIFRGEVYIEVNDNSLFYTENTSNCNYRKQIFHVNQRMINELVCDGSFYMHLLDLDEKTIFRTTFTTNNFKQIKFNI